jgi:hypothetical protein
MSYFDRGNGVAAARQGERLQNRQSPWRSSWCPSPNWSNSNTPTGPFHTTVPAFMMMSASTSWALFGPMSKDHVVVGYRPASCIAGRRHQTSCRTPRQRWEVAPRRSFSPSAPGVGTKSVFAQRLADVLADRLEESVGDAAADHHLIHLCRTDFPERSAWSKPWNRRR